MDSLEQKIKAYVSSVEIPDKVNPEEIRKLLEDNGDMTAGVFLRKLKELKISGSDFLELKQQDRQYGISPNRGKPASEVR